MLVYGDASRQERAGDKLDRVRRELEALALLETGLQRHAALTSAMIEAGELAQGLADAAFRAAGDRDVCCPAASAAMTLTRALADRCAASWLGGFAEESSRSTFRELDDCASLLPCGALIEVKQPEGHGFYCVYPEAYFEAARGLPAQQWQVIGVRSIGTSLACMVAAALGAGVSWTLRPVGHPFKRQIACDADADADDREAEGYAIVDEGPGQSGSSMAAVAEWLIAAGALPDRIHFFVAHGNGPRPRASPRTLRHWAAATVHVASFENVILNSRDPCHRLDGWIASLVGPLGEPLLDISGGAWRHLTRGAAPAGSGLGAASALSECALAPGAALVGVAGRDVSRGDTQAADSGPVPTSGGSAKPGGHAATDPPASAEAAPADPPADEQPLVHPWQERRKFVATHGDGRALVKFAGLGWRGRQKFDRARTLAEAGFTPLPLGLAHGFLVERWSGDETLFAENPGPALRADLLIRMGADPAFRARSFPAERTSGASAARCIAWAGTTRAKSSASATPANGTLGFRRSRGWRRACAGSNRQPHASLGMDQRRWPILRPCYLAFQLGYYTDAQAATMVQDERLRLRAARQRYEGELSSLLKQP